MMLDIITFFYYGFLFLYGFELIVESIKDMRKEEKKYKDYFSCMREYSIYTHARAQITNYIKHATI